MSAPDDPQRLWELSRRHVDAGEEPMDSDERLVAYREGRLTAEEANGLEARLVRSAALRRRLAELGGVSDPVVPAGLRARVLAPAAGARRRVQISRGWLVAASMLVGVALLAVIPMLRQKTDDDPIRRAAELLASDAEFRVGVSALAEVRSHADSQQAQPQTPVTVAIEPIAETAPGLEFGLYRLTATRLVRVQERDGLSITLGRGAAKLRVVAAALVGPEVGRRPFFVAIGPAGRLVDALELDPAERPETILARRIDGRAYRSELEVVLPR